MPDGEVLNGRYQIVQTGAITFGSATAFGPAGSAFASGSAFTMGGASPVLISAAGGRGTVMNCQGSVEFGHGGGVCETNAGARYQVMF